MKFDDHYVERVRNSVNIVDLISGYVQLRKRGQNYTALCPFHNEKTPSFSVSENKQIFKCFGCGEGGDVFAFVQQIENLSFPEAISYLAERFGIPLPQRDSASTSQAVDKRSHLLELMQIAESFFRDSLSRTQAALDYLAQRRIDEGIIAEFGLGFAPQGSRLLESLRAKGFRPEDLAACGLVVRNEAGEYYDKFRNRIMFPIRNLSAKTIAFGGRILGEGRPKYLNSPETPLYHKGHSLYGLATTRDYLRQKDFAILVEGYFDCIVPFQFGVRNVVASLGTSLTEGQIRLLGRYTRKVIVSFDPDSAGINAATRSIDLFLSQGFYVNVLQIPGGDDPDSFIRNQGVEAYLKCMKDSQPYIDFLLNLFIERERDAFSPKGKQVIVSQILPYLRKLPSPVERAEYASRISSRLRIDESILMSELRKLARGGQPSQAKLSTPDSLDEPTPAEKNLLAAVFSKDCQQGILDLVKDPNLFEGLRTDGIFKVILELKNQKQEISVIKIRNLIDTSDVDLLDRLAVQIPESPVSDEVIRNSVSAIHALQLDRLSRQIQEEIARVEQSGDSSNHLDELLRRKESIRRERQSS